MVRGVPFPSGIGHGEELSPPKKFLVVAVFENGANLCILYYFVLVCEGIKH